MISDKELMKMAEDARKYAYCPYSGFSVGAAVVCADGTVYTGCNIENSAFGPGNCAERTAIFKAVSEGRRDFLKMAVAGGKGENLECCYPCGVCRQVMSEFCNPQTFQIICGADKNHLSCSTLAELLPHSFSL